MVTNLTDIVPDWQNYGACYAVFCLLAKTLQSQGGHKPGKHGKPGKLREFEKLSKSQGKLREI